MPGPGGNRAVISRTAPHNGFRGRGNPNPTGHRSLVHSPLAYRQEDPNEPTEAPRYADEVGGIVPGYKGHVPRAQHLYGRSAYGDPDGVSHSGDLRLRSGEDAFASGFANGVGIDARQTRHPDTKRDAGVWSEGVPDYSVQVGGVLPGYKGHVPRAIHKYGASAVGNTPQFGSSAEHNEVEELRILFTRSPELQEVPAGYYASTRADPNDNGSEWWPHAPPYTAIEGRMVDYRDEINGVLPRYAGHVPRAKDKCGGSHYGRTRSVSSVEANGSKATFRGECRHCAWILTLPTLHSHPLATLALCSPHPAIRLVQLGRAHGWLGHGPGAPREHQSRSGIRSAPPAT